MLDKLKAVENRFEELCFKSEQPDFYNDPKKAAKLLRERNDLEPIIEVFRAYKNAQQEMLDAEELMIDPEMKELCQETYAQAKAAKEEAMAIKATYEQNMLESKAKAEKILLNAQQTAAHRGEQIISDAQKTAVAMKQKAEAEIAQEKKRALNDAKNEISEMAMAIAGKVVGRELTAEDHAKMVDSFIDELGGEV